MRDQRRAFRCSPVVELHRTRGCGALAAGLLLIALHVAPACAQPPSETALRERYAELKAEGVTDSAGRMLEIRSRERSRRIVAEIYALVPFPFAVAGPALKDPAHWCEILMLHLDTKDCAVTAGAAGPVLHAGVVTHYDQPASTAYRVDFDYRLAYDDADYIDARLGADDGPLDTRDFRIRFEAVRTDDGNTFAHMSYSYAYGGMSELALRLYLLTFGRNKVGFTVTGTEPDGTPRYVGGMRGVVERNTMRYYLAVEAWLGAAALARGPRLDRALRNWYAAIERYPRQLHELTQPRYLAMKRRELDLTAAAE